MKYICMIKEAEKEEIFVFPTSVNHDCMAEVLGRIKDKSYGSWKRESRMPISAGFVGLDGVCYGESESLQLKSRPEDTEILKNQL